MSPDKSTRRKLKLAAFTDEISQDFERAVAVAQEYELDGIEVRSVWNSPPQDIPKKDIQRMKKILADTPLHVCCIASPFYKCELGSEEEIRRHHEILKRCIALGKELGCSLIRGFTFWRRGPASQVWNDILAQFEEPLRILEANGAMLGIENESSTYIGTGRTLRRFLDELASDRVKAVWDAANSLADVDEHEVPYPDGYLAIRDTLIHVHVKDGRRVPRGGIEHTPVGEGDIGYAGQFRALIEDGFDGYCSLETHWRPKKIEGVNIDRPGGAKFSEAGEVASRKCLENIMRILASL